MNKKEITIFISIGFIYIGNVIYEWSLEGRKDIDWTHQHIKTFGIEIFISSILYFVGFLTLGSHICSYYNSTLISTSSSSPILPANNSNNNNNNEYKFIESYNNSINISNKVIYKKINIKSPNLIYRFITIISFIFCFFQTFYQITKDVGATLVNHGQYNLMALSGFLILYSSTFLTWWLLLKYFKIKRIIIGLLTTIALFVILFKIQNIKNQKEFLVGIDGKELMSFNNSNPNVCKINNDFIVWPAYQPTGSTWILAGSRECPKDRGFSYVDDNNYLHIDCDVNEKEISYTTSPTFFKEHRDYGIFTDDLLVLEKQYKMKKHQYYGPTKINDETIMATCGNKTEIHFQNILNPASLERASNFNQPKLSSIVNKIKRMTSSNSNSTSASTSTSRSKPVDILFILIDALSRAHFKRALPKTFNTLQAIQNEGNLKVFQFFRFHSLKPYSDQNWIGLYTGYNSIKYDEIDKEIVPENVQNDGKPFTFEEHPLFFQSFRNDSYITSWIYPACGDFFKAFLNKDKPFIDHELVLPFCAPQTFPFERPYGMFEGPYSIRRRCIGNKHIHDHIFQYINKLYENYSSVGKIISAGLMDAHEGTMEVIQIADNQFNRFIGEDLKSKLNDTFLFLVSDHGNHMGPYYSWTLGGSTEVAFPVAYIILPSWFTDKYPDVEKNLLSNENKLFSPFQLYDTIRALSKYPEFGGIDVYDQSNNYKSRGLLESIPDDISCSDLGIPHQFCKCK